jgi:hypothetical protein
MATFSCDRDPARHDSVFGPDRLSFHGEGLLRPQARQIRLAGSGADEAGSASWRQLTGRA